MKVITPDKTSNPKAFAIDFIENCLVKDTLRWRYSMFPNLKFLTLRNCQLEEIPEKLKYRKEMIGFDFSRNKLEKTPAFLNDIDANGLLSVNLAHNQLNKLDTLFLDNFTSAHKSKKEQKIFKIPIS